VGESFAPEFDESFGDRHEHFQRLDFGEGAVLDAFDERHALDGFDHDVGVIEDFADIQHAG
jgi:hypothetical protein